MSEKERVPCVPERREDMEINGFAPKDVRVVLTDAQVALLASDRIKALEDENKRLEAKIDRLFSFLGLRG